MTEIERLEEIRFFFKKNKTDFANLLGYKYSQNYNSIVSGKTSISIKVINAIKEADQRISIDWLLWGQGNMLLSSSSITDQKIMNGDHTQATVTGNITNNSFDKKDVERLQEKIDEKETTITLQQKLLESKEALLKNKEVTIELYLEHIASLKKELERFQNKSKS